MDSLYKINNALLEAMTRAEIEAVENDGEIAESTGEELDRLEMDRDTKIENTALFIKNLSAEIEMIKIEEKNLKSRRAIVENKLSSVKEWLKFNLNGEKRTAGNYKISYRKSTVVEITDVDKIGVLFVDIKSVKTPNKARIKKTILSGIAVDGAVVIEKQNMEVK